MLIEISSSRARGFAKCASEFTELSSSTRPGRHKNECACHTAFYLVSVFHVFPCLPRYSLEVLNHAFLLSAPVSSGVMNQKVNKSFGLIGFRNNTMGEFWRIGIEFLNPGIRSSQTPEEGRMFCQRRGRARSVSAITLVTPG